MGIKHLKYNYILLKGRPVYQDNGDVRWGGGTWYAGHQYPARLVVYYSVGGGDTRGT